MNEDKELEEAIEKVNKIRLNFYDKQYKKSYTDDELTDMCNSLSTILQYIKYDSIPKKKIEDALIEKQRERKPYYKQNMIMLKFIDKESAEITKKDLEINDKSMQLYGSTKTLQELLEDK